MLAMLAAPCSQASAITEGAAASCDGILWGVKQSKAAITCARVELPVCKADLKLQRALLAAELARVPPEIGDAPSLKWLFLVGGVTGGVVAGFAVGLKVML